ncbi:NAD-dependent epimerase/dehydratase family protein [Mycobacterium sp.]|uniref:NAD-dependent epimerase/dehydratase family protein n=1 Tax=Mycobacterium sp. TaxID=1785 RepID=UPI003D0B87E0
MVDTTHSWDAILLSDKKILITGATGQIGRPIAERLVGDNEVWCAARFSDPALKRELEDSGIKTCTWSLDSGDFSQMPDDFTHVLHAAFLIAEPVHDVAVRVNTQSTGQLMQHCRKAESFVFVSASAVYEPQEPGHLYAETDPLGGLASYMPSYPVAKIACEGVVHAAAHMLDLPSTIARMNIGYGMASHGGVPVMYCQQMLADQPIGVPFGFDNWGSPIHEDDIAEQASGPLFDIASLPVTIINWAGNDAVSHRELCDYIGELTCATPQYLESELTFDSFASDNIHREKLIGACKVHWRDGVHRTLARHFPDAIKAV